MFASGGDKERVTRGRSGRTGVKEWRREGVRAGRRQAVRGWGEFWRIGGKE
ncbi:hypothetical protein [Streptomyces mexicanus]|uniref:hypothetical protein n=1 Tax=Streptomyces mexicanus TaxID=178566 RepID=UPI0031F0825E